MRSRASSRPRAAPARTLLGCAAVCALAASGAHAFSIVDDGGDWAVRWDNTLKASTKYRLKNADPALSQSFNGSGGAQALNFNAGDQNFQRRGIVSERLDLLSELDVVYRKDFGLRLSGAGWFDQKLQQGTDATDPFVGQHPVNEFTPSTRTRAGRKAEVLDAFVFGGVRFDNDMKATVRLGRHALQYGESFFFGDNGIARAQGPIDIEKLLSSPGAQFKEIIRPVPQVSSQLQINANLAIGAYYQFRWEEDRLPPAGSYFSVANVPWGSSFNQTVLIPPPAPIAGLYALSPGADQKPRDSGQFGAQVKWRVAQTDLGLYYARYHDKGGQLYGRLSPLGTPNAFGQLPGSWYYVFPEGIRVVGASASRSVGDVNLATEVSVRNGMPLRSTDMLYPEPFASAPAYSTGKTAHVNFSWIYSVPPTFLSNEATWMGELAWNRVLSLRDPDRQLDTGRTRDATAVRMLFTPVYRQILQGLDLNVPMGIGYSLKGNSSITAWGAKNTGDLSIGVEGNYLGVWQMGLTYTRFLGKAVPFVDYSTLAYGLGNHLADRDFIALSLRRTF